MAQNISHWELHTVSYPRPTIYESSYIMVIKEKLRKLGLNSLPRSQLLQDLTVKHIGSQIFQRKGVAPNHSLPYSQPSMVSDDDYITRSIQEKNKLQHPNQLPNIRGRAPDLSSCMKIKSTLYHQEMRPLSILFPTVKIPQIIYS